MQLVGVVAEVVASVVGTGADERQGVTADLPPDDRLHNICDQALALLLKECQLDMIQSEISVDEFEPIYIGEEQNAEDTPLQHIYPQASHLVLYALTVGSALSDQIQTLFEKNDYALAGMLDAAASLAAEQLLLG